MHPGDIRNYLFSFLFVLTLPCFAQSQKPMKVELLHADFLEYNENVSGRYKRLMGNVQFKHEDALMNCDSAHFFSDDNYMEAYSHVHIRQGDTLNLFGDLLKYFGNIKKAELYDHVVLKDNTMTLTTDRLDYDMNTDVATYQTGARIVSKEDTLTSKIGYYYSDQNMLFFHKDVVLVNPDNVMNSDTLKYNTESKTAYFLGPSTVTGVDNFIYCERGWYNTEKDISDFGRHAFIKTGSEKLWGDSILYDKAKGLARAFGNIVLHDTTQRVYITGDYGWHNDTSDSSLVTGHAVMVQVMDDDTLFLHADTLLSVRDSLSGKKPIPQKGKEKSADQDSAQSVLLAFHHVKIFKSDMQGKCDSLAYSMRDSMLRMFQSPIMWSDENQLTGDLIMLQMANGHADKLYLRNNAFIISEQDTSRFNQVKGKDMTGYFEENELRRIYVQGNGQTVYYAKDKINKYVGVNKAEGANMMIYLKENKVDKITLITKPEATFYPVNELSKKELLLKDFIWRDEERPLYKEDIFIR